MSNYFKNIYDGISTAAVGMKITFSHLFQKKVTMQYPEIYHPITSGDMPKNSRNRIFVEMDGCDGCNGCARVCPVNCITVETEKVVPGDDAPDLNTGKKRRTWVLKHEIDFAKCCFCSLCTEACPTNAIYMTQEFEYSSYYKEDLIYNFSPFNDEEAEKLRQRYVDYQEEQKRLKAEKKKAEAEAKKKEMEEKKKSEAGAKNDNDSSAEEKTEKEIEREKKRAEAEARKKERLAKKQADAASGDTQKEEKSDEDKAAERERKRAEAEARKKERLAKKQAEAEANKDSENSDDKNKDTD